MRDVEVLLWTTSSGKRLRLGSGDVADGGGGGGEGVLAPTEYEWGKGR